MIDHLVQGIEAAVVHIGRREGDVAKAWYAEFSVSEPLIGISDIQAVVGCAFQILAAAAVE